MRALKVNIERRKNYLESKSISKAKLCKECNISINTLDKILSGKENVRLCAIYKISKVIGLELGQLIL